MITEVISPEIERIEKPKKEETILEIPKDFYEDEMDKLKKSPVDYICNWMENNLIHIGKEIFKLICLQPCSMIIPSIEINSIDARANINIFILGSPSSGKTSICKKFLKFSYFPMPQKGISAKRLIEKIGEYRGMFSIAIDDFSNILNQRDGYFIVKILEGGLGDDKKVSDETMVSQHDIDTQAVGLICGTWQDLERYSNYLKAGLLSRMSVLFISLNEQQRKEKSEFITKNTGDMKKSIENRMKEQIIADYYQMLYNIQAKKEGVKIEQIRGYSFNLSYKEKARIIWWNLIKDFANDINGDFSREFQDFDRFLISHAFINVFNRKVENGILYPINEDYSFATKMMEKTLINKLKLIKSKLFLDGRSPEYFIQTINSPLIDEDLRNIMINIYPSGQRLYQEYLKIKKEQQIKILPKNGR